MSEQKTPEMKPVEVILPVVKLRLEDVSYMRGLQESGMKCKVPDKNMDRLRVLGMVKRVDLPPCPKLVREWKKRIQDAKRLILKEARKNGEIWDFSGIVTACSSYTLRPPDPRREWQLTPAALKLLKTGSAKAQIEKGCR